MTTCVLDAYGTLFDTGAAVARLAAEPEREALARAAPRLAERWRERQLAYTGCARPPEPTPTSAR